MLDLLITNGRAVTPHGAGAWDVAVQGERIVAVTPPGTFTEAARIIDAAGMVVVPGGVEPHTHLAHRITMHPDEELFTLGPEEDSRGMAFGGTTTHVDFCFVRPGGDVPTAIEQRVARWRGQSYIDYSFHVTLVGALPLKTFDALPEAIQQGFPSFKVFTTDILPPHERRPSNRLDFGRIQFAMEKVAAHDGIMVVHAEDHDIVQFMYERFREEGNRPRRAWRRWPKRAGVASRSTPRPCTTTRASPPRTTARRGATATTPTPR
jgi:dihydropyrimidinase